MRPLSPRAARVLFNVADAWGGGDVDLVAAVERSLADARERRWLELVLLGLEWEPRLRLRSRRGFAWQTRETRRALLAGWERSRFAPGRRAALRLRALVEAALAEARQSRDGA